MKNRSYSALKVLVLCFLVVSVLLPLLSLLTHMTFEDMQKVVANDGFSTMLINSVSLTLASTLISVLLAFVLAWMINRSHIRYKAMFSLLFTLPMLIPSISHGMGLVLLFGDNGLFTNWTGINLHIYGAVGIILGSVLYSFPVAFLMLTDIFKYEDYTIYESAEVLGLSKWQQFTQITLSNLKRPLVSVVFAVFTMIFTDYGVPLVVGGKVTTLPVYVYREVVGLLNYSKGAVIGVILLLPAFIAFILDLKNNTTVSNSTVVKPYQVSVNKKRDTLCYIVCILVVICVCLPILTFMFLSVVKQYPNDLSFSLDNIIEAMQLGVDNYLLNSLAIAMCTALLGTCISYLTAYMTARSKRTFSTMVLHLISMLSLAIPGIVLGLSYVLFFKGSLIYGTLAILIVVNTIHFFASPYLLAYNSLTQFNANFEDVAQSLGISKLRMLKDVYLPSTMDTIVEMYSYMFVNSMMTISAVSFLASFKNMPLALLIPQFDSQSLIEATAFISIVILAVNVILKVLIYLIKKYVIAKEYH